MADLAISIAGKLIEVIASEAIQKICRVWGYKDELEELNKTITTIKNVLLDADSKRGNLSNAQQGYIAELKDAVYDADDLFDEFRTLVELNLIDGDKGDNFSGKVRRFFSSQKGKLSMAYKMSCRVEEIKGHLDGIASNYTRFGFSVDYKPIVRRREDTCSYVDTKDIIGRDKDKDAILDMLLASNGDDDDDADDGFRFLTIVGVGGLGKTALAQLVFNDEKIEKEFSSSRLWVCISDQEGVQFDVKTILLKILEVATKNVLDTSSSMQSVQNQFLELFRGEKYFIVLDDVWNEDRGNWINLKKFLMIGARGSRIVVTSRSERTCNIIGNKHAYKLQGLSKEDSKRLFEMAAFEGEKHPELVRIGENIARKCCGMPLALKVVGSLLFGQEITKWQSIERSGLADIDKGDNDKILPILKLSYDNLTSSLKNCFSYCAIYPKDFRLYKEKLIGLWMAQGYIVPLDGGQCLEDAAEEHFSILMRRCFFQDIKKDEYGNIEFVKIHDLMHDVAQEVAKEEIYIVTSKGRNLGQKIRHVNIDKRSAKFSLYRSKLRSYICNGWKKDLLDRHLETLTALRVLDLSYLNIESLPQNIDSLLLLRYLNLHGNSSLKVLHDSITRLYNLQTLVLRECKNLRELPKDFSNLINLRHLDLYGCDKLNEMPLGILNLINLRVLPYFVANNEILDEELKVLQQVFTKLKGKIHIEIVYCEEIMKSLAMLWIDFGYKGEWVIHEGVLEKLELPLYLNALGFSWYNGTTTPWPSISPLQYLLRIEITYCWNLEQIPVLSKLPHLKSLQLMCLSNVEYLENVSDDTKPVAEFFPSLESLDIVYMYKLKGWCKGDFPNMIMKFPRLSHLLIEDCPNLTSLVPCSNPKEHQLPALCTLKINSCPNLVTNLFCPPTLEKLVLQDSNGNLQVLERVLSTASSLRILKFCNCNSLRRLPRLDHLSALEKLTLAWNNELSICEEDDDETWKFMPQSLHKLKFNSLPRMKCLPKGIQHLSSLQTLTLYCLENMEGGLPEWMSCLSSLQSVKIWDCKGIQSFPEAIKDLTSLKRLCIIDCPDLAERCEKQDREDYSKIQHIPDIFIINH